MHCISICEGEPIWQIDSMLAAFFPYFYAVTLARWVLLKDIIMCYYLYWLVLKEREREKKKSLSCINLFIKVFNLSEIRIVICTSFCIWEFPRWTPCWTQYQAQSQTLKIPMLFSRTTLATPKKPHSLHSLLTTGKIRHHSNSHTVFQDSIRVFQIFSPYLPSLSPSWLSPASFIPQFDTKHLR